MSNSLTHCVDASMIVRHVTSKTVTDLWESWMQADARIVAPSLLYYEVTNGLYRYQKTGILPSEAVKKALTAALMLPIDLVSNSDLHVRAKNLAVKFNLPATYDAHYLALAEWMGIELWTADTKFINTLKPFKFDWVKGIE